MLLQYQIYHNDYAYSFGGVATSGSDVMDFSTQVPPASGMWVSAVLSYHTGH
jgi:hypothetical protein